MPKTWTEKLQDAKDLPRVETISGPHRAKYGGGTMLIPAPSEVDEIMRKVPRGKLITINEIRSLLATKHGATITCPITTGIFAWIAAHAAEEAAAIGRKRITPYWRTLKTGGHLNPKYPGGAEGLRKRLEAEGHSVIARGKNLIVVEYERSLAKVEL
jgi:hypothetical protein